MRCYHTELDSHHISSRPLVLVIVNHMHISYDKNVNMLHILPGVEVGAFVYTRCIRYPE